MKESACEIQGKDSIVDEDITGLSGGANNPSDTLDKRLVIFQQLHQNIKDELTGNVWEITNYNPLQFIVAHSGHNQIIRATVKTKKKTIFDDRGEDTGRYDIVPCLKLQNIMIGVIPVDIIIHENPLGFIEHRYTIRFISHTGKTLTIGPKTLEEIVSILYEKALVFVSRGASESLSIIVSAFTKDNKIRINDEIDTPGFYYINDKLKAYHVNHPKPSKKDIQNCCDFLDLLVMKFRRKDYVVTSIKWGVIAPYNFAIKQYTEDKEFLPWIHAYGWTRTGKTTIGASIINGIWGNSSDKKHKIPFSSVDSEAKLGFTLSQTTYPITINEVGALADDKHRKMLEMVKNSIETKVARSKHIHKTTYSDISALCPCVLTSNSKPSKDPGYVSRTIPMVFTKEDRHNEQEKKDFNILMSQKGQLLRLLGDFTVNYMMKHPEVLLRKKKEDCNWKESAKEIIVNFYEMAGRDPPSWIELSLEEMQIEDSIDDSRLLVRAFFINLINETFNKYSKIIDGGSDNKYSLQMRFIFCCENGLIPSMSVINEGKTIVIFNSILNELHNPKYGIDGSEIAGLQELANTLGLRYGQKWLNGTNTRVVDGDTAKFLSFIDNEVKNEDPNARLITEGLGA